jgi:hypothetical protein
MPRTSYPPLAAADVTPMLWGDDYARTRRTDPVTSHLAGDASQRSMYATKRAVLHLVMQEGEVVGSEINDLYRLRAVREGWGRIAYDTPRKRAGELCQDGYLEVVDTRVADGNSMLESVYAITDRGRHMIAGA